MKSLLLLCSSAAFYFWGIWVGRGFITASNILVIYINILIDVGHFHSILFHYCLFQCLNFGITYSHFKLSFYYKDKHLNSVSWNVKGLNHPIKRKKVISHLKQLKAEIVFLQETHIRSSDNSHFLSRWSGQSFHSPFQAKAGGLSVLIECNIPF